VSDDSGFPIPAQRHRVETAIERSRFITTVEHAPTPDTARAFIDDMRREFPDANHNCWAYVCGPPASTASIGMSDAGEPHGTAGRPMLDVLLHSGIGEVAVVVTRYFGGVKLGKGGLVKAYGGCVQSALASLPTVTLVRRTRVTIHAGYGDIELLRRVLAACGAEIVDEQYGENVVYVAEVPHAEMQVLSMALSDGTAGRAVLTQEEE
jgi:uncharacterized YigZ family protein